MTGSKSTAFHGELLCQFSSQEPKYNLRTVNHIYFLLHEIRNSISYNRTTERKVQQISLGSVQFLAVESGNDGFGNVLSVDCGRFGVLCEYAKSGHHTDVMPTFCTFPCRCNYSVFARFPQVFIDFMQLLVQIAQHTEPSPVLLPVLPVLLIIKHHRRNIAMHKSFRSIMQQNHNHIFLFLR